MRPADARTRTGTRGFTLLEVLAAVALLGLVYTVLAGVVIRGLRAEGESQRRLEASLIADRTLAELELLVGAGTAPAVSETETEEGNFLVLVRVSAVAIPFQAGDGAAATAGSPRPPNAGFLLTPGRPGAPSPLRRIEVRVSWFEGADERNVARTTYGLDLEAIGTVVGTPEEPAA